MLNRQYCIFFQRKREREKPEIEPLDEARFWDKI
jgi:hypothetical protein